MPLDLPPDRFSPPDDTAVDACVRRIRLKAYSQRAFYAWPRLHHATWRLLRCFGPHYPRHVSDQTPLVDHVLAHALRDCRAAERRGAHELEPPASFLQALLGAADQTLHVQSHALDPDHRLIEWRDFHIGFPQFLRLQRAQRAVFVELPPPPPAEVQWARHALAQVVCSVDDRALLADLTRAAASP